VSSRVYDGAPPPRGLLLTSGWWNAPFFFPVAGTVAMSVRGSRITPRLVDGRSTRVLCGLAVDAAFDDPRQVPVWILLPDVRARP
jgi:hypothetical protein